MNFAGITHIVENPKGHAEGWNYGFVGSVPIGCMEGRKPTIADVMGGRVQPDGLAYRGRKLETIEQAVEVARQANAKLCQSAGCSCRKLF